MNPSDTTQPINQLVDAINKGNIEEALTQYEPGATFVAQPGQVVSGTKAIREALAGFIALKPTLTMEKHQVVQSGDIALYCSKWNLNGTGPDGKPVSMSGTSTDILRCQPNGTWLIAVDNPWGPAILG